MRAAVDRLTINGWALFAIGLAVAGSAFAATRIEVFGLSVHPNLLLVALIAPIILLTRLHEFPTNALVGLILFTAMYSFSNLGTSRLSSEVLKVGAITLTLIVTALLVRTPADFRWGVMGLMLATLIISIRSLEGNALDSEHGAIDVGHKNTLSLYLLPPLLLASYMILQKREVSVTYKLLLIPGIVAVVAATFTSANRSGWVGQR